MTKKRISLLFIGFFTGAMAMAKLYNMSYIKVKEKSAKQLQLTQLFNQWLIIKNKSRTIENYLLQKKYFTIAIYGMGYAGQRLYDELVHSQIHVAYAIDQRTDIVYDNLEIVTPGSHLKEVDAIIVTAVADFNPIKSKLKKQIDCPIISMEDILYTD